MQVVEGVLALLAGRGSHCKVFSRGATWSALPCKRITLINCYIENKARVGTASQEATAVNRVKEDPHLPKLSLLTLQ